MYVLLLLLTPTITTLNQYRGINGVSRVEAPSRQKRKSALSQHDTARWPESSPRLLPGRDDDEISARHTLSWPRCSRLIPTSAPYYTNNILPTGHTATPSGRLTDRPSVKRGRVARFSERSMYVGAMASGSHHHHHHQHGSRGTWICTSMYYASLLVPFPFILPPRM